MNNPNKIKDFTDLMTWQESHKLVIMVYKITGTFPSRENYSLTDQIRRAIVSVTSYLLLPISYLLSAISYFLSRISYSLFLISCLLFLISYLLFPKVTYAAYDDLTDGLVGWWKMDESSDGTGAVTRVDSSGNANDLTDNNTTASGAGKFGNGADFEKDNSENLSITDASQTGLDFGNNFTISLWLNQESFAGCSTCTDGIISKGGGATTSESVFFTQSGSFSGTKFYRLYMSTNGSSWELTHNTNFEPSLSTWYHVSITYNNSETIIYINGEEDSRETFTGTPYNNSDPFYIAPSYNSRFDGAIDEVRVYNRALSSAEVRQLYRYAPPPVAYYSLNENTGIPTDLEEIKDHSGNENHGEMETSMTESDWIPGKFGSTLDFDGTDDYVSISDSVSSLNHTNGTISAWVNMNTAMIDTSDRGVVGFGKSDNSGRYIGLHKFSTTDLYMRYTVSGTSYYSNFSISGLADQWVYVTGVWEAGYVSIYKNGVKMDEDARGSDLPASYLDQGRIGADSDQGANQFFQGAIDEVKIYNYTRTQEQIIQDMNGGHPVGGSPVGSQVGWWKFDEGYGDTAYDSSPHGNDGNLAGTCPGATTCPTWTTSGKFGSAIDFQNSAGSTSANNDYIDFGDATIMDGATEFTASLWIYIDNKPSTGGLTSVIRKDGSITPLQIGGPTNMYPGFKVAFWRPTLKEVNDNDFNSWNTNQWYHYAVTWKSGDYVRMYRNGQHYFTSSSTYSGSIANSANALRMGATEHATPQEAFDGKLDEVKLYNVQLTPEQVAMEYNQGKTAVFGSLSTESDGSTPSNSASREFCIPGDTSSCDPPVGWWKFDENTGTSYTYDSSGNNLTGTMNGTMTESDWVPGKFGSALEFDGINDYIYITDGTPAQAVENNTFTISTWMFATTNIEENIGLFSGDAVSGNIMKGIYYNDGTIHFSIYPSDTSEIYCESAGIEFNQWNHTSFVVDGSNAYIYLNGARCETFSSVTTIDYGSDFSIGMANEYGTIYHKGMIDDFRIYDYARTPAQIAWDYNRGAPIAWWKFDECSGATAYDSSKNGNGESNANHGTISFGSSGNTSTGTCSSGVTTSMWNNGTDGKRGASLDFDGTDDVISVSPDTNVDQYAKNGLTICGWINPQSDGESNNGQWFKKHDSYIRVDTESAGTVEITALLGLSSSNASRNTTRTIPLNDWSHICVAWEDDADDELSIYLNSKLEGASTNGSGYLIDDSLQTLYIGGDSSWNFDGQIDDVKIFNYALTEEQVELDYNKGAVNFGN